MDSAKQNSVIKKVSRGVLDSVKSLSSIPPCLSNKTGNNNISWWVCVCVQMCVGLCMCSSVGVCMQICVRVSVKLCLCECVCLGVCVQVCLLLFQSWWCSSFFLLQALSSNVSIIE